jgi:hypothetical protein
MAGYFSYFPKLLYTFDKNSVNQQAVTNILARSTFLKNVANNTSVYFEYQVKDSDTPEIIADKIYGDPFRAWIVLLFNNVINPNYNFPMKNEVLDEYVQNKYNQTVTQAKDTIHHYEKEITNTVSKNALVINTDVVTHRISEFGFNFATNVLIAETLPTVADTSVVISTVETELTNGFTHTAITRHKAISNYTYEFNENESRRAIKLLDPAYVQRVEQEFKQLMSNG